MSIKELYLEFLQLLLSENKYLKSENIEDREIIKFTDKKKILMDIINKRQKKETKIEEEEKKEIFTILKEIRDKEVENQKLYILNMEKLKKDIQSLKNEKKLKNTYYSNINEESRFDKKK